MGEERLTEERGGRERQRVSEKREIAIKERSLERKSRKRDRMREEAE